MQLGMIGLGRMGANASGSLADFVGKLEGPRNVRIMIPVAAVDQTVSAIARLMEPGDVLSAALFERFSSRGESGFADKRLSAMRGWPPPAAPTGT
ncbi:MAG: hypothetical protein MUP74_04695 [Desulfobacterales bacterium]|nr:hypothetical protein [Desulfobacterales bacterium]